jgi:hypothetical protein
MDGTSYQQLPGLEPIEGSVVQLLRTFRAWCWTRIDQAVGSGRNLQHRANQAGDKGSRPHGILLSE